MKNLKDFDISNTDIQTIPPELEAMNLADFHFKELDINYHNIDNAHIQPMIGRMLEKGINVSPRL